MSEQALPSQNRSPRYDAAIKLHTVEQVLLHHQSVAQQLQCSPQSVANWVKQHQNDISHATNQPSFCQQEKPSPRDPVASSSRPLKSPSDSVASSSRQLVKSPRHSVEPLSFRTQSFPTQPLSTRFLPVEVGEIPPLISHDESLLPCRIDMISRS